MHPCEGKILELETSTHDDLPWRDVIVPPVEASTAPTRVTYSVFFPRPTARSAKLRRVLRS